MALLALPEKNLPSNDLDIGTGSVRAWLDTLPPTQPAESALALLQRVHRANRTAVPADDRLEFLRAIRPLADMVIDELSHACGKATVPLSARARAALDASHALAAELSLACRIAAVENAGRLLAFGAKRRVPALLVQAVDWLTAVLMASYRTYTPVPAGTWMQLHDIIRYARGAGFAAQPIEEEVGRSVQSAYCEALLIALADPYRLRPGEIDALLPCASTAMAAATLWQETPRTPPASHFAVPCDADRPPRVAAGAFPGPTLLLLDANGVIDRLRARRTALRELPPGNSGARAAAEECALIEKLMGMWGGPPRRGFRRGKSESTVAVCVGLAALRHFIEKESAHEELQRENIRRGITMPLLAVNDDDALGTHPVLEWDVVDEGAGGLKVRRSGARQAVSVGELVGIRMLGRPRWIVAVVRWMSSDEPGGLQFGVQFLAPGGEAIWLQPTISALPQARPALLLQRSSDSAPALLSPPDSYSEMREFEVRREDKASILVRATELIERTAKFEMFGFREENAPLRDAR